MQNVDAVIAAKPGNRQTMRFAGYEYNLSVESAAFCLISIHRENVVIANSRLH